MQKLKDILEYTAFILSVTIFKILPCFLSIVLLKFLFYLFGYIFGIRKKIVTRQLKLCFPEKSSREIKELIKKIYSELAITVAEVFIFEDSYFQNKIELENFEEIKKALALGRGVMIVSAHFSNWEIGAKIVAKEYSEVYGVVKNQRNKLFNDYLDKKRKASGIKTIEMRNALKNIVLALKKNQVVVFLVDQYATNQGVETDFMGHKTKTYTSAAQISHRFKTPIIVAFDVRDENGKHKIIFSDFFVCEEPVSIEGSEPLLAKNEIILDKTRHINFFIEEYIKKYPHLWFWVHRKWR